MPLSVLAAKLEAQRSKPDRGCSAWPAMTDWSSDHPRNDQRDDACCFKDFSYATLNSWSP
jgi:hypothetical protein